MDVDGRWPITFSLIITALPAMKRLSASICLGDRVSGAILHHNEDQTVTVAINETHPEMGVVVSGPMILLKGFVLMFGIGLTFVGCVLLLVKLGLLAVDAV